MPVSGLNPCGFYATGAAALVLRADAIMRFRARVNRMQPNLSPYPARSMDLPDHYNMLKLRRNFAGIKLFGILGIFDTMPQFF